MNLITNIIQTFTPHPKPNVEENKPTPSKPSYLTDLDIIREKYGELTAGKVISVSLKELLKIIPRHRPRIEAYMGLVGTLKRDYGVELKIYSQKTKPKPASKPNI